MRMPTLEVPSPPTPHPAPDPARRSPIRARRLRRSPIRFRRLRILVRSRSHPRRPRPASPTRARRRSPVRRRRSAAERRIRLVLRRIPADYGRGGPLGAVVTVHARAGPGRDRDDFRDRARRNPGRDTRRARQRSPRRAARRGGRRDARRRDRRPAAAGARRGRRPGRWCSASRPASASCCIARHFIEEAPPTAIADGDRTWVLVFLVLLVHSLPEGFAIGTAYASTTAGLGLFIVVAIAIQNVPEGTSTAIPMATAGYGFWAQFWAAVLTSVPQPIGAVIAYLLVEEISALLPVSFAFAGGAMLALVVVSVFPDALRERHPRCVHRARARRCLHARLQRRARSLTGATEARLRVALRWSAMDDSTLRERIEGLVAEERRLLDESVGKGPDDARHERLQELKVELDQCLGPAAAARGSRGVPARPREHLRPRREHGRGLRAVAPASAPSGRRRTYSRPTD